MQSGKMQSTSTHNVRHQELKTTDIPGRYDNNVNNRQFTYKPKLIQNMIIKQNRRTRTTQHEREFDKAPSSTETTPNAQQESLDIRTSITIILRKAKSLEYQPPIKKKTYPPSKIKVDKAALSLSGGLQMVVDSEQLSQLRKQDSVKESASWTTSKPCHGSLKSFGNATCS
ncbi:hypothetical protein KIN20_012839 [Parelaphostrongylus tenuis]|uniref:Uncharacterized protein n=1 Tax=Parelaphostrongylus tenuis TaxID=148309 RepID=A0AAD5MB87_PARTN|nr:hypothetical protein KIN20_012839 [Parelaphostrongylus tenuis]